MKTGTQLVNEITAQAIMQALRIRDRQFRQGTPPRVRKHVHSRGEGPAGRNPTVHMLVRSVNKGFASAEDAPHVHPRSKRAA